MGVSYTLRVVEEKVVEQGFYQGERFEDQECSWVASVNIPGEGIAGGGVANGGPVVREVVAQSSDGGSGGDSEEAEVQREYENSQPSLQKVHGDGGVHEGDGSVIGKENKQDQTYLSGGILVDHLGNLGQRDTVTMAVSNEAVEDYGALGENLAGGDTLDGFEVEGNRLIVMCQKDKGADLLGESKERGGALNARQIRSEAIEPTQSSEKTRFTSLPPNRDCGPKLVLGRNLIEMVDFNDSISLIEYRGGADNNSDIPTNSKSEAYEVARRGRSRKPRDRSKQSKQLSLGKPKFVQLGEALKEVGGRRKKRGGDAARGRVNDGGEAELKGVGADGEAATKGAVSQSSSDSGSSCFVPESDQGITLEVVLPICQSTPKSGFALLQQEALVNVSQQSHAVDPESSKLLKLQQQVGFQYKESDEEVIKVLTIDEQSDRKKKLEWEQKNGSQ
ncbi:hypothetical protein QL285_031517 [Trifolium repens]|nr:hypothetical protein QL285_031517 [Trifolium repens]